MLYEIFWVFYALGIAILISIGILGIFSSLSIPSPRTKVMAMGLSIAIIFAGLFFSYRWNVKKKESEHLPSKPRKLSSNTWLSTRDNISIMADAENRFEILSGTLIEYG